MHDMAREELDHLIVMAEKVRHRDMRFNSRQSVKAWADICRASIDLIADLLQEGLDPNR